tara:strand:+ start:57607 stop:58980 length:1374 start_codon:yes stop_codon:yes gene_type:complete
MNHTQNFDVIIIGGGFSGAITAINLLNRAEQNINIGLINHNAPLSKGIAYSTEEPYHLLNVPAGKMSAFPDKPNDFIHWLAQHPDFKNNDDLSGIFVPRKVYGEYIQFLLSAQIESSHSKLEVIKDEAIEIQGNANSSYSIQLKSQPVPLESKHIVLALGNALPYNLLQKYGFNENTTDYISNPWDFNKIKNIPQHKDIFIIGSGLTTVDLLLTLKHNKHQGKINILSRHGLLPKAHEPYEPVTIAHDIKSFSSCLASLSYMKSQLKKNTSWRAVIDSIRPVTQDIWLHWSTKEKARFLKHLRAYWDVHRHRIAPQIMQSIQELIKANQVNVKAGNITGASLIDSQFKISYIAKHNNEPKQVSADYVINATGPNYISYLNHPLVKSLVEQNLTGWDEFKLGFNTNKNSLLMNDQSEMAKNLYAIGPLTKSTFWEIIAVPDIRGQAAAVTHSILSNLR